MLKVIITTLPISQGQELAQKIIESKLAACVNLIPKITSFFIWEEKIQKEEEALAIIKTLPHKEQEMKDFLAKNHPYQVPEILTFNSESVNPSYLQWMQGLLS